MQYLFIYLISALCFCNKRHAFNFAVWRQIAVLRLSAHNRQQQAVLSGWLQTQHLYAQSGEPSMGGNIMLADRAQPTQQPALRTNCHFLPSSQKLNVSFNKAMMSLNLNLIVVWFKIWFNESMAELMFDLSTSVQSVELIAVKTLIRRAVKQC